MEAGTKQDPINVGPDEFPFYVKEPLPVEESKEGINKFTDIPQGRSSKLDSDQVDGFNATTASTAGPNILVATDGDGKMAPSTVIGNTHYNWCRWIGW